MTLEELANPLKWADEQVLRQYTKIGKKLGLDKEKRKYVAGALLHTSFVFLTGPSARALGGYAFDMTSWATIGLPDNIYNWAGLLGRVKDEETSDAKAVDADIHFYKIYNSYIRLPVLCAGVGLIGKYCFDMYNHMFNGVAMDSQSQYCLTLGIGYVSAASSMYIKEMNPKLLQKQPLRKQLYNWITEKLSPTPEVQPNTQAISASATPSIDDYVSAGI